MNSPNPQIGEHSHPHEEPKKTDRKRGVFPIPRTISDLRDSLIFGSGIVYILGYAVWTAVAYTKDLGLLPVLEAQYFMAGIIPALLIAMPYVVYLRIDNISDFLRFVFGPEKKFLYGLFRYASFFYLPVLGIIGMVINFDAFGDMFSIAEPHSVSNYLIDLIPDSIVDIVGLLFFVYMIPALLSMPYLLTTKEHAHKAKSGFEVYWIVGFFLLGGLFTYIVYFEDIPQEFGGIASRCARIDFSIDQISDRTRILFTHIDDVIDWRERNVLSSKEVEIVFRSRSLMLVESHGSYYEFSPSVIRAISWCD